MRNFTTCLVNICHNIDALAACNMAGSRLTSGWHGKRAMMGEEEAGRCCTPGEGEKGNKYRKQM
jgi:hypothetical protein